MKVHLRTRFYCGVLEKAIKMSYISISLRSFRSAQLSIKFFYSEVIINDIKKQRNIYFEFIKMYYPIKNSGFKTARWLRSQAKGSFRGLGL
jgi:hypothetical protein